MKRNKVTMVGNSHIDPVWLWRAREGFQAVKSTFASALERMKEFDEFHYTASSTAFYVWIEKNCPALLEEIRARVQEGRWHLAGGWWVEPDCNIPGGESLARQGLYGQRELDRLFGRHASFGYNVDSFGHQAGIPAILAGPEMNGYVVMRPFPEQCTQPGPAIRWQAEDGSAVTGSRCGGEYCAWTRTAIVDNLEKTLAGMAEAGLSHLPVYYGVGNHGGGPTIENIKTIRELRLERPELDMENGGPEAFFDTVDASAPPLYTGELEGCFPGCFTTDAELKRLCRACEEGLIKAEILSVMAGCEEETWPALTEAWKLLLFEQFHDTLAGTARREARDDAAGTIQRCLSVCRETAGLCIQRMSDMLDTRGDGFPLLVINPTDRDWDGLVEADIEWRSKFPLRLKDSAGKEIVYDYSVIHLTAPDTRKHLVFRGQIPAFGAAVYRLMPEEPTLRGAPMNCEENTLENDFIRVRLDPQTGMIDSIFDKAQGQDMLRGPAGLYVYEDRRDTWGAMSGGEKLLGAYQSEKVYREENGAVRSTLTVRAAFGRSTALLRYSLEKDGRMLSLDAEVNNQERQVMTVFRLPLRQDYHSADAEAAYTEIRRPYPAQAPACNMQRTLDLTGDSGGLLIVNRAKYAYRTVEGALEIPLSRSCPHAFGAGQTMEEGREYDFADLGKDEFALGFLFHAQPLTRAERVRFAQRLNRGLETLLIEQHRGPDPRRSMQLLRLTGSEDCVVTAVKRAEDGGLAVRIQNCSDREAQCALLVRGQTYPVSLPAWALVTVLLRGGEATIINLLENHEKTCHKQGEA